VRIRVLAFLLSLPATGLPVQGPPAPSQHARVTLISQAEVISSNSSVQLGVHFVLEPGWHIYWINPGDSGQPPGFKWQLPEGFSAGEIQWPRPERMQPVKELADYGYHSEVLLPFTLHVPALRGHALAEIGVEAKWLVCREVCIPEHEQLHLVLPVAAQVKQNASSAKLFADAEKLLPKPLPRGWKASAISAKDDFLLSIVADRQITKAEFFPLEPDVMDNPAPQKLQPLPTGIKLVLRKSDLLVKPISLLRGVLVIPGSPAYKIEAPVRQPIQ
jgi:DsbC/DsbD-like thiol-disulfide interchange protein